MLEQLLIGFESALTLTNLLFIAAGITIGIVIGAVPGLGSVTALAVLVPVTYYMSPIPAILLTLPARPRPQHPPLMATRWPNKAVRAMRW